jgi:transcription elongation factor Elf1
MGAKPKGLSMQKGHILQFNCQSCQHPIQFSVFDLEEKKCEMSCSNCKKKYSFDDDTLKRQLKKFAALCRQIIESEEILGSTAVGIDIGDRHIKIPYKLLLTRLSSSLDLMIGDQPVSIEFRIEPGKDIADISKPSSPRGKNGQ